MVGTPKNSDARSASRRVGHRGRVEAGEQHGRGPGQQGAVDADAQPVGVEDGQAVDQPVVGRPPPGDPHRLGGGQQVPVAEHRALGCTGGARGVADEGRVVRARPRRAGPGSASGRSTSGADAPAIGPAEAAPHPLRLVGALDDGGGRADVGRRCGPARARCRRCWPGPPPTRPAGRRRGRPGRRPTTRWTTPPGPRAPRPAPREPAGHPPGGRVELPGRPPPRPRPAAAPLSGPGGSRVRATAARRARPATGPTRPAAGCPTTPGRPAARSDPAVGDHASAAGSSSPSLGPTGFRPCTTRSGRLCYTGASRMRRGLAPQSERESQDGESARRSGGEGHATGGQVRDRPTAVLRRGWRDGRSRSRPRRPGCSLDRSGHVKEQPHGTDGSGAARPDGSPSSPTPTGTASGTTRSRPSGSSWST